MTQYGQLFCPATSAKITLGAGSVDGLTFTTSGDDFAYSGGKSNKDTVGDIWIQASGGIGNVAAAGITLGTDAGIFETAGGDVIVWAGSAMSPSLGSPDGPASPPTAPTAPAGDVEAAVTRANGLNAGIKAGADIYDTYSNVGKLATDGASAAEAGGAVYDAAKASWDMVKAGVDVGTGGQVSDGTGAAMKGIDGLFNVGDAVRGGAAGFSDPTAMGNPYAAISAYKNLSGAVSGKGADPGASGAPGADSSVVSGSGKIEMQATNGIKMITPKKIERIASENIEAKTNASFTVQAVNKVETCSLVFEAHANVSATMKGLARAKVESVGAVGVSAGAKMKIDSGGPIDMSSGANTKIIADANLVLVSKSNGTLHAASNLTIDGKGKTMIKGGPLKVDSENSTFKNDATFKKKVTIKGDLKAKAKGTFTGKVTGKGGGKISGSVQLG